MVDFGVIGHARPWSTDANLSHNVPLRQLCENPHHYRRLALRHRRLAGSQRRSSRVFRGIAAGSGPAKIRISTGLQQRPADLGSTSCASGTQASVAFLARGAHPARDPDGQHDSGVDGVPHESINPWVAPDRGRDGAGPRGILLYAARSAAYAGNSKRHCGLALPTV